MDKKVCLVTGGSRGIGKAVAKKFAENGYQLVINYVSEKTDLKKVEEEIKRDYPIEILFVKADVTDMESCENMVKAAIEKWGRMDVVVNNAGITKDNLLMRMKEEEFDQVIDVNLKGAFNVIKSVSRPMIRQKSGRIINISSIVGSLGNAGQTNYVASKSAIDGMTKSVARELASKNITVNAVAPGFIESDMTDVLSDEIKDGMLQQIPLKHFGSTEDIANAVSFLASDQASYITGQVLHVNGGMYMG